MFTAAKAWSIAKPIIDEKEKSREAVVERILEQAEQAAKNGKTWLQIDYDISGYPYRRLKELGYDVGSRSDQSESYFYISWFQK